MNLLKMMESGLGDSLNETLIKRGWDYYRSGNVMNVKEADDHTLYGAVQGSDVYAIVLDAGQFRYSKCTCPFGGYCKHMAAVFFAYLNIEDKTGLAAKAAYRRLLGLDPLSELTTAGAAAAVNTTARMTAAASAVHPSEEDSPADWQSWIEQEYGRVWTNCRHSLHALQPVLSSLKGSSKDWELPMQRLHWMNAILFVLEQAEYAIKSVDTFSRYYHEMSFMRMAEPWVAHYYSLALELEPQAMDDAQQEWIGHIVRIAFERALKTESQLFDWGYIYLALCEKMSENANWHEEELERLLQLPESPQEDEEDINRSFVHSAIAMLSFFAGRDAEAIRHFGKSDFQRSQKVIYPCAAQRLEEGDWERFGDWMSFLYERIYPYRSGRTIGPFVTLCRRADEDQPEEPRWSAYMTDLLPHSYMELSDHWLAVKKYEEWADLQLLLGMKPDDLSVQDLKEVTKAAPQYLLPLYHQSIEECMASRNRQGYRMAVKQLKKLERLYKAEKNTEKWDMYLAGTVKKYQRLRAFQEELWKGKLTK
ncbi:SWIM zinc finger domain-containing protein [Paenibacillus sp. NPDC058071]|uniref:SWIM zinc finger family protein n=1 Tax=Paenibacillus sp. NPDC058071 TaxID=3346326 RepID=UPI0036D8C018